jgi:hypothetical protein
MTKKKSAAPSEDNPSFAEIAKRAGHKNPYDATFYIPFTHDQRGNIVGLGRPRVTNPRRRSTSSHRAGKMG